MPAVTLTYHHGTLVVTHVPQSYQHPALREDPRTGVWRAPAHGYRSIVEAWHRAGLPYEDAARDFAALEVSQDATFVPHPHQQAAFDAWRAAGSRAVVVLPTGAGKTFLAVMAIRATARSALVVVPTIDLLQQWQKVLEEHLRVPVGMLGGGAREHAPVTVTTYDSAAQQSEFLGNRYGLLICDECHHLPAASYQFIAAGSLAPYRLGLTATLERADGGHRVCGNLLGRTCYQISAAALEGAYLAPYDIRRIDVTMSEAEQAFYDDERARYIDFLRGSGVSLSAPNGWAQFIMRASLTPEGRRALQAYRAQRRVALTCTGKIAALWAVLMEHRHSRSIIFTDDNATVYQLSRMLLLPAITHHTGPRERQHILAGLASGTYAAVLTSRVLNEGVDVPDANVGIVLSGSGSVREHVQRLGRLLRKRPDKRALLVEICSSTQAEQNMSERRRQHQAYEGRC